MQVNSPMNQPFINPAYVGGQQPIVQPKAAQQPQNVANYSADLNAKNKIQGQMQNLRNIPIKQEVDVKRSTGERLKSAVSEGVKGAMIGAAIGASFSSIGVGIIAKSIKEESGVTFLLGLVALTLGAVADVFTWGASMVAGRVIAIAVCAGIGFMIGFIHSMVTESTKKEVTQKSFEDQLKQVSVNYRAAYGGFVNLRKEIEALESQPLKSTYPQEAVDRYKESEELRSNLKKLKEQYISASRDLIKSMDENFAKLSREEQQAVAERYELTKKALTDDLTNILNEIPSTSPPQLDTEARLLLNSQERAAKFAAIDRRVDEQRQARYGF